MASREFTLPLSSSPPPPPQSSSSSTPSSSHKSDAAAATAAAAATVVIPDGTFLYALMRHAQRDQREWGADALEFRPERWLVAEEAEAEVEVEAEAADKGDGGGEKVALRRRPFYAPFSLGPRDCAGKTLALVTLHTALAVVCSRFQLVEVEGSRSEGGGNEAEREEREKGRGVGGVDARGAPPSSPPTSSSSSPSRPIDLPEKIALTAHPARPLLELVPR